MSQAKLEVGDKVTRGAWPDPVSLTMSSSFQIKEGLLGGYKICYPCPHCSASLSSPLDEAGNHDICPQCNRQFIVPGKSERDRIRSEEKLAADVARAEKEKLRQEKERKKRLAIQARQRIQTEQARAQAELNQQAASQTRTCPYCGEEIFAVAKKCKHCGEFLDQSLRQQVTASTPSTKSASFLSTSPAGCGCLAVLALLLLVVAISVNSDSEERGVAPSDAASTDEVRASLNERWTKSHTPAWARLLDTKVQTAFTEMMNDPSPLYSGFFCNGTSTKVYVNRAEWRQLTRFQATNNLMLAVLLPHTDNTLIGYVDDNTGEALAVFTPTQPSGSISVVHP